MKGNLTVSFLFPISVPAPFSCSEEKINIRQKSETGTLASYNYPLPYDANIECIWLIDVDQSYNVELSFEFFNLSSSSECSEDYVIVRDGLYSSSDVVGNFCGSNKPQSITSVAWDLRVEFKSSGKAKFPGFKARYEVKSKYETGLESGNEYSRSELDHRQMIQECLT